MKNMRMMLSVAALVVRSVCPIRRCAAAILASIAFCCAFDAFALTEVVDGVAWTYTVWGDEASIGGGDFSSPAVPVSTKGELAVPSELGGCPVTAIDDCAFSGCGGLTSVTIPKGVTSIGYSAFYDCSGLKSVSIPEGVTSIGMFAFSRCGELVSVTVPSSVAIIGKLAFAEGCDKLTAIHVADGNAEYCSCDGILYDKAMTELIQCPGGRNGTVTVPSGVTSVGEQAFCECYGLASVTLPPSVTSIGEFAFCDCIGLTSMVIPSGVTDIGDNAFFCCSGLVAIDVAADNAAYCSHDGILYDKAMTKLISCPEGICGSVTIPSGVTSIGDSAFRNCEIRAVTFPSSITSIGAWAFDDYYILAVFVDGDVPSCVADYFGARDLGFYQKSGEPIKYNWKYSTEGESVTVTGVMPALGDLVIPSALDGRPVTKVADWAFSECSGLKSVTMPSTITRIGEDAFGGCSGLESVTIPESVTSIGSGAFSNCSGLKSVTIPEGVTSIGWGTFSGCSGLTSVTIPSSVTSVSVLAFMRCDQLAAIHVAEGSAAYCSLDGVLYDKAKTRLVLCPPGLSGSVTIPSSVTIIDVWGGAFSTCSKLTAVHVAEGNQKYCSKDGILYNKEMTTLSYCPAGRVGAVTIPSSVRSIGNAAFEDCVGLTAVAIPEGVTSFGENAFNNCSGLESVTIPSGVTSLDWHAFSNCSGLKSVVIPSSVTSLDWHAFSNCSGLKSVVIPSSVTYIGHSVFMDCSGLESVTIPEGVTGIGEQAFLDCSGLESVAIPSSVTYIGYNAFSGCSGLKSVTIPSSVTSIGENAFRRCSGLESVTIPPGLKAVGRGVFYECSRLKSVTIPSGVTSIGEGAFGWCSGLVSVVIPSSVTSIEWNAFDGCYSLKTILVDDGDAERVKNLLAESGFYPDGVVISEKKEDGGPYVEEQDGVAWTFSSVAETRWSAPECPSPLRLPPIGSAL